MNEDTSDIKTDIAVIKRDVQQIENAIKRFDHIFVQLTEIIKQLAVQDKMFESAENRIKDLEQEAEEAAVAKVNFERSIKSELNVVQKDLEKRRDEHHKEVLASLADIKAELVTKLESQEERIDALERWRYYLLGIGGVIIFVLSKLDFPQIF